MERTKILPKERERIPLALAKEREQEKMEKMVQCWNCGKTGYQYKDCWTWPQQQSQGQSNSLGTGK